MIRIAKKEDLPQIIRIFKKAFPESVELIFKKAPKDRAILDIYEFLLDIFPDNFFVQKKKGKITGYILAPFDNSIIIKRAIFGGYIFKWAWHYLTRQYGFGLKSLWIMLANKIVFLRNQNKIRAVTKSRILSIAVDPDHQGERIGTDLLIKGLDKLKSDGAKSVVLEVRERNEPAYHIYKKFGFKEIGRFRDKGGVWIQMVMNL